MLLTILGKGQGAAGAGVNVSDVIERLLPAIGASKLADLVYWDEDELFEYADEAIERLARRTGLFIERDTQAITAGTASYDLPTRHISTVHVSVASGANLRGASVRDLESLSERWESDSGTVQRFTQGFDGTEKVRLYKNPSSNGTLAVIFHQYPSGISAGAPTLTAPTVLEDYVSWGILAAARAKECDAAMPEIAKHATDRMELMEQVIQGYWGASQ